MALTEYMQRTQLLLKDENFELTNDADVKRYINWARGQIAGQTECVRVMGSLAASSTVQQYPFSSIVLGNAQASGNIFFSGNPANLDTATFNGVVWTFVTGAPVGNQVQIGGTTGFTIGALAIALNASVNPLLTVAAYTSTGGPSTATLVVTYKTGGAIGNNYTLAASAAAPSGATLTGGGVAVGLQGVLNVRQITYAVGQGQKFVHPRPFPYFNLFFLANAVPQAGPPSVWSQYGQGSLGSVYVNLLDSSYNLSLDCSAYPASLNVDTDVELIPALFTDAIPFLAAHFAFLSLQQADAAKMMMDEYQQFIGMAKGASTPKVLPGSFAQSPDMFTANRLGLQRQSPNA